ncbi:MarR family transcriptional regulator [Rhizobium sp. XQZ8]|uniref:MarR family winged helix-turn-helix transcriptional regulator n=1 Tax=Rhizobium populisoli TaxID=2859785 RepID=UPI001C67D576|nr:MarR family transcriptional regulator [Rhizobium populisoli]MBW6421120.1 MarR family transcriptional regulator [Rhizobium populisoli]
MQKNAPKAKDVEIRLDAQLCFAIYGAAHAFNRTYKPLLEPLGLTYPQYLVMLALWEEDGHTVKVLGEKLGLDSGTLSPLLKRLEQSGLVARQRDPQDERQVVITLTEKGAGLKAQADEVYAAIGQAIGCSVEEAVAVRDSIIALKERLNKAGE